MHMTTPGGFPGVTPDWVHTTDFELIFGPSRDALRRNLCTTRAQHSVILS
jgi:hypothetical protein